MNRQLYMALNWNAMFLGYCIVLAFLLISAVARGGSVSINEFMASNSVTIADEDGDFEDWIELHNYGEEPVNLQGWGLSDNMTQPHKWMFPSVTLEPGGFLLVWASGKDRHGDVLHTNFSISSAGEPLLLVMPDGNWKDIFNAVFVPTDVSYGRQPDGVGDFFYFKSSTPGKPNAGEAFQAVLEPPAFSHPSSFLTESFDLSIFHNEPDVTIVYTLDGSDPSLNNLSGSSYNYKNHYVNFSWEDENQFEQNTYISYLYNQPVTIKDRSQENNKLSEISTTFHKNPNYFPLQKVPKGTVVRTRAYKEGNIPSEIISRSFFITPLGRNAWSVPVVSLFLPEYRLFDYSGGLYIAGEDFDLWRAENLHAEPNGGSPANYHRRGDESEIPGGLDFFGRDEAISSINQNIGIRIHGNWTRAYPLKSFRLYPRNQYGNEFLDYDFFGLPQPHAFKRLLLRNSGNDYYGVMFRDAYSQAITRHMNFATQAYLPTVVFINGEYWGIMNIRERQDKHYLHRHYGVDPENLDILTSAGYVEEGDEQHYRQTLNFIRDNGLEAQSNYEYIQTRIDVENFADYKIANIFLRNTDWPFSNIDFWRLRTDTFLPNAPYGHDGRWRWILYDTDHGFGLAGGKKTYRHNTLAFATDPDGSSTPNLPWSTFLLRSFLENDQFRTMFINRFADQLNTAFLPERTLNVLDVFKKSIEPEIEQHINRWRSLSGKGAWVKNVDVMIEFAKNRPQHQREHILEQFGLSGTYKATLDVSHPWHGHIRMNTIDLQPSTVGVDSDPYPWQGLYFNNVSIEVHAQPAYGYQFSHWKGASNSTVNPLFLQPSDNIQLTAHFVPTYQETLLHFWFFGEDLPNNEPLQEVAASFFLNPGSKISYISCMPEYPYQPGHDFWRAGSMERRNNPTSMNYRPEGNSHTAYGQSNMRALQVKQPMYYNGNESELIFHLPTTGQKDIVFRFAMKDEGAAHYLLVDYATDSLENWTQTLMDNPQIYLTDVYQLAEVDFSNIEASNNNPDFKIRIRFGGPNVQEMDGNRVTFNNFSLDGIVCRAHRITAYARGPGAIFPNGRVNFFENEEPAFLLTPLRNHIVEDLLLDGVSVAHQLSEGAQEGHWLYIFKEPLANHTLEAVFSFDPSLLDEDERLIVYPNPTKDVLYVASLEQIQKIELFDLKGAILWERSGINNHNYTFYTDLLQPGMFILIITVEEGQRYSRKVQVFRN